MKHYSVFTREGERIASFLTERETVRTLLSHKGHSYRIITRPSGECALYVSTSKTGKGPRKCWAAYTAFSKEGVIERILTLGGMYGAYAVRY